ncbi:hypothetical protein B0I37DRAFT_207811 [Chaetomium sp. MPI-CAGE-AT-0009]|nr:hypothetical protein B0I37DRAFT_207811 [Chaetomium sp. MPI-CAGE-AT-0009]
MEPAVVLNGQHVYMSTNPGKPGRPGGEDLVCSDASVMKVAFLRMFQEILLIEFLPCGSISILSSFVLSLSLPKSDIDVSLPYIATDWDKCISTPTHDMHVSGAALGGEYNGRQLWTGWGCDLLASSSTCCFLAVGLWTWILPVLGRLHASAVGRD